MSTKLIIPDDYTPLLKPIETQIGIKLLKETFEKSLSSKLNLTRVSAPIFLEKSSGLNDNLNGFERFVTFDSPEIKEEIQIVQSLAKWKRYALHKYQFENGSGLYTDMNAIRRDEELDNLHSIYVDQWDWEKVIGRSRKVSDRLAGGIEKFGKKNKVDYLRGEGIVT